jgi:aspartyl-tRNA(Asn)/glutamyl-tRNA(Gln) amidotransferase subunit B
MVGLEVHVELATATKLFSGQPQPVRRRSRTPTSTRSPSASPARCPVLNRHAVELAMRIGLPRSTAPSSRAPSHRKNYFYPDMPKAYQISQYDHPLNVDGYLDLPDGAPASGSSAPTSRRTPARATHVGGTGGRIHGSEATR